MKAAVARLSYDEIRDSERGVLLQPLSDRIAERVAREVLRDREHLYGIEPL
jgi:hypothetical protein